MTDGRDFSEREQFEGKLIPTQNMVYGTPHLWYAFNDVHTDMKHESGTFWLFLCDLKMNWSNPSHSANMWNELEIKLSRNYDIYERNSSDRNCQPPEWETFKKMKSIKNTNKIMYPI